METAVTKKRKREKKELDEEMQEEETVSTSTSNPYDPIKDAGWKSSPVPYSALTDLWAKVEGESKRLKIIEMTRDFLRSILALSPETLLPTIYLLTNQIAPAFEGKELGVGDVVLMKAVCEITGMGLAQLRDKVKKIGDLSSSVVASRSGQQSLFQPKALTIESVYASFRQMSEMSGKASANRRKECIKALLVATKGTETKFLVRALQGKLRIGLAEPSVLVALAHACVMTPPKSDDESKGLLAATRILKQAYTEVPSYDVVIPRLLQHGISGLPTHCFLTPGIPIKVMLGKPSKGIQEVVLHFGSIKFTLEFKYDGERAQIHLLEDGTVRIFSRNLEDNTSKYPDLVSVIKDACDTETKSCILDCEVVAWDTKEQKILPFQALSHRKRKNVDEKDVSVQVCLFAFDLIYRNGRSLLKSSFAERRKELHECFKLMDGKFNFAESMDTDNVEDIEEFMKKAMNGQCEGLMVKGLDVNAEYVPNKRNWLKLKKDYLDGVGDTLDLVPIGAFHGKGKRTGHFGAYLLACYDEQAEEYQSICKIGTGFTDVLLESLSNGLQKHILPIVPREYKYPDNLVPDVWFDAKQVWEVLCADISISPVHKAALGVLGDKKGVSIRFPRFVKVRGDKTPEQATSSIQVVDMYRNQSKGASRVGKKGDGVSDD